MAPQDIDQLPIDTPLRPGKYDKAALLGNLWGGVCFSLLFVIYRIYFRLRLSHKLFIEDYFILSAWIFSLSNAMLWTIEARDLYIGMALGTDNAVYPPDLFAIMDRYFKSLLAMYVVQYAGLWSVKFSLLFFFRGLGRNIKMQRILWWCAAAFISASFVVCIGIIQYKCMTTPFPKSVVVCTTPLSRKLQNLAISLSTCFDTLTDVSIIVLSTNILWKVKIDLRRKLALFAICSLTAFVIAVAIFRLLHSRQHHLYDLTSLILWGGVELSVSVVLACLASFRTLYTASRNTRSQENSQTPRSYRPKLGTYNTTTDDIPLRTGSQRGNSDGQVMTA